MTNQSKIIQLITNPDFKKQMSLALPKHLTADKLSRIALTEVRKTPKLADCTVESFAASLLTASQLGLEIGAGFGQCYLMPYKNECQLVLGFRGMVQLAYRSGMVNGLHADIVYESDFFEYELGSNMRLSHKPTVGDKNKDNIKCVYAYAKLPNDGFEVAVLDKSEIMKIKSKSRSSNIWNEHFEEMAKKTALRRLYKTLPVSADIMRAFSIEDDRDNESVIIDAEIPSASETAEKIKTMLTQKQFSKSTGVIDFNKEDHEDFGDNGTAPHEITNTKDNGDVIWE